MLSKKNLNFPPFLYLQEINNYYSNLRYVLVTERKQLETAARQMISQNKRRYQQDGYDLDLTYVTKRVIATSFPSTGLTAM